jgi:RHS repeat-associated protein
MNYDQLGRREMERRTKKIQYPQDPVELTVATVCYGYNSFGLVSSVGISWTPGDNSCSTITTWVISNMEFNEFRQTTSIERGNGVTTTYEYDIKGRITKLLSRGTDAASGLTTTLQDSSYTYLVNNNIAAIESLPVDVVSGAQVNVSQVRFEYTYDGLSRLIDAKGQYAASRFGNADPQDKTFHRKYEYAANGNLTAKEERDFTTGNLTDRWNYSYNNHRAVSISSTTTANTRLNMSYDAKGNMTSKEDTRDGLLKTMQFDSNNRIRKVSDAINGKVIGNYYYDDQGFRVRRISEKTDPQTSQTYTIEMQYHNKYFGFERQLDSVGAEISGSHHAVNNVYLNGTRIAAVTAKGQSRYYLADQVDSVNVVTNEAGTVLARTEYLPYGEEWVKSGDANYKGKFNGQELDTESGFYYYNARHYDPQIARFVTADTVVDGASTTAGWNRYMYVHGNPVMYKDPSGHDTYYDKMGNEINNTETGDNLYMYEKNNSSAPTKMEDVEAVKGVAENNLQKVVKASEKRTESALKSDNTLDVAIEMNVVKNISKQVKGTDTTRVVGKSGTETVSYRNQNGEILTHTAKDVNWEERADPTMDPGSEHPAKAARFNFMKNTRASKDRHPMMTDHPEPGVNGHEHGPYNEGCIEFDTSNNIGKETFKEMVNRTVGNNENIPAEIIGVKNVK